MMYTSGKNEGELDGGEGNVVGINNPSSLGGAKDDILLHGTPGFGRRRDADHDYDPSSKGKNLGFQNKQSGVHAAKKRRIGEIASSNISDQHNFLSPNNHGAPLQEEALRAISKGQSNQGSVFNLNQNIDLRSSHLGRLQQQQEDTRSTQLGRLQQQHAALEARLQQEQQLPPPQGMGLGGPAQSPFGNFSGPATGMFPQASLSLLGQSVGGHPMFGAGGMIPGLMGGTGLSGMMDPNSLAGLGGFGTAADRSAMAHQLSFPGVTGIAQTNSGGAADFGGDDTTLTSLGLTSSTGRQLLLMQQALSGGGAMLPGLQGQFLASMQGFGMPSDPSSLGQQKLPELGIPGGVRGGLQLNGNSNGNKGTSPNDPGASTTLSGISHQALYSRDIPDEDENDCDSKKLVLYMTCDDDSLSAYQCLVRKQIELFAAKEEDVESNAQGRNKPIILGQVGIRCRHCSKIPPRHRTRGATYYPAKLHGLYQAAQNMASAHLCNHCQLIPDALRQDLVVLRDRKSSAGGGKQYWADGVRVLGVVESNNVLLFEASAQAQKEEQEETSKSDTTDIGATGPNSKTYGEEDDKEEKESF